MRSEPSEATLVTIAAKTQLLQAGLHRLLNFCRMNNLECPEVIAVPVAQWRFSRCAYYRPSYIKICLERCAPPTRAQFGRQWSWPGYVVDRTPFGVLAHELGHHVDVTRGRNWSQNFPHGRKAENVYTSDYSKWLRGETGEPPITTYCPNDGEWFAEMFRLFVTNPDLLRLIRPATWKVLSGLYECPESRPWAEVLREAPDRVRTAAANKIREAYRRAGGQT